MSEPKNNISTEPKNDDDVVVFRLTLPTKKKIKRKTIPILNPFSYLDQQPVKKGQVDGPAREKKRPSSDELDPNPSLVKKARLIVSSHCRLPMPVGDLCTKFRVLRLSDQPGDTIPGRHLDETLGARCHRQLAGWRCRRQLAGWLRLLDWGRFRSWLSLYSFVLLYSFFSTPFSRVLLPFPRQCRLKTCRHCQPRCL